MRCTKLIRLMHLNHVEYPDGLLVPCGKCSACRIARRQEWSMRVIHELAGYKDAVFSLLHILMIIYQIMDHWWLQTCKSFLRGFVNSMQKKRKNGIKLRYYALWRVWRSLWSPPLSRHCLWFIITSGGQRFGKGVLAVWFVPFWYGYT